MTGTTEIWLRPWARFVSRHRLPVAKTLTVPGTHRAGLRIRAAEAPGPSGEWAVVEGFPPDSQGARLFALPVPPRRRLELNLGGSEVRIDWPGLPERPKPGAEAATEAEPAARALMDRAEAVWGRLREIDELLEDPATLWPALRARWMDATAGARPPLDIIVAQAEGLGAILDELRRAPRRVLRRTHRRVPVARVTEIDRRSMLSLARQPGETLAERAGDRQRLLAPVREESFDTLENRVLRGYADLADRAARAYCARYPASRGARRWQRVDAFGRACRRIARELEALGVRLPPADATPNFVLQENPGYRAVWRAWLDLLRRERTGDEIWRWQARSWEEFGALAVMVALAGIAGARPVATAPLLLRGAQDRGSWIAHDNPLGVFHLPREGLVVEVKNRMEKPGSLRGPFAAPVWVSVAEVARSAELPRPAELPRHIAVWPLWDAAGGLVPGEAAEVARFVPRAGLTERVAAAILLRPAAGEVSEAEETGEVLAVTLGTGGAALRDGLESLGRFLTDRIGVRP